MRTLPYDNSYRMAQPIDYNRIQLKTFNDGYKLRKLLKDFSSTEEDYCNLYEHRVIANNECIAINDTLSINRKNIYVTFYIKIMLLLFPKIKSIR